MEFTNGWVKINRSLLRWEWYDNPVVLRVWLHILLSVNYEEKRWHGITILPGQMITSISKLAKATGLTIRQTRTALDDLQSTGELTRQTTNRYTLITVEKWAFFQDGEESATNKATNKRHAKGQTNDTRSGKQTTTTKEIKNKEIKNKENSSSTTNIWNSLSQEDFAVIEERFGAERAVELVDLVHEEVDRYGRHVEKPLQYVLSYAERKGIK